MIPDLQFNFWLEQCRDAGDVEALRAGAAELHRKIAASFGAPHAANVAARRIRRIDAALAAMKGRPRFHG